MNYSEITTATESTATVQPEDYHAAAHATAAELVKIFDRYITAHPDVFKAASCGGPVVNWEWYEVMYGERYMDTPQENPSGYENANIIPKIKNVKCPLLVMHGAQDHTVVQQHTLELLRQAVSDDIELEYFVYTVHDHNVIGPERRHLYNKLLRFHNQNTKGE